MAAGSGTDVSAVFDFLRRNGFAEAESVLQEEIGDARGISDSFFVSEGLPSRLPPVRVAVGPRRVESLEDGNSTSSSSDAFVSMGSSVNSELVNPYGVWSSSRVQTDDSSSDRLSEFGTARDYNDSYWYNEIDRGFSTSWSIDKFVTNMDAQDRLRGTTAASASGGFHSATSINSLDNLAHLFDRGNTFLEDVQDISGSALYDTGDPPLCDCCAGVKGYYGLESGDGSSGQVRESKTSSFECYEMSDDPNSLDAPEMSKFQLNLENDVHEVLSWKQDIMRCSHQRPNSSINKQIMVSPFDDKEFRISDSFVTMESLSQTGDSKYSNNTHFKTRIDDEKFTKNANTTHLRVVEKDSQPNGNAASEDGGEAIEECHDTGAVRDREEQGSPNDLQMYENPEDEFEVFDLRIIHRKNRTGFEENKDLPVVLNTIIAGRYYVTEYLGSAAFSKVIQAHDLQTGIDVCLKIIKNDKDFFDQSLDEIKLLKFVNKHDPTDEHHILRLYDYFYHQEHLFIVCELLRANLYEFQKYNRESGGDVYFTVPRLQTITRQCLEALEYLHQLGIIHCDLKPENILMKSYSRCEIKVIDLGSSCFQSDNLCLYVQSRSYRAPEVIMGLPYDSKIDIWSLGCILAELCSGEVLFPNDSVVMLLARMIGMLGPIDMEMLIRGQETQKYFTSDYDLYHTNEESGELEYIIPEKSSLAHQVQVSDFEFIKFISELLQTNPVRRPTATEALQHPWLSHPYNLDLHEVSK